MTTQDQPNDLCATAQPAGVPTGLRLIGAESVAPQAWRNGGGQTRELLAWPAGADWRVRISRADIEADGPFSAFPQVERWFTVLQGAGVVLSFGDTLHRLAPGDAPLRFDGAAAPGCRLLDGATQDLNLMLRGGTGVMRPARAGEGWSEAFAMRGLYTTVAGLWRAGQQSCAVAAHTLLWAATGNSGAWTFEAEQPGTVACAWWLGFTAEDGKSDTVHPGLVTVPLDPTRPERLG